MDVGSKRLVWLVNLNASCVLVLSPKNRIKYLIDIFFAGWVSCADALGMILGFFDHRESP